MNNTDFGKRLRQLRKQRGISQRDLAPLIGINFTYICKVEKGQMYPPSEQVIRRIAQVLDADENELINLAGKVPKPLKEAMKDNPLLVELVRIISERKLSNDVYKQMLDLAEEKVSA